MPELSEVASRYQDRGVTLVTVVTSGDATRIRAVAARAGLDAPVLFAGGDLLRTWHVDAVPWTVIFGRDGKPHKALRGGYEAATFDKLIRAQL